MTKKDRKVSIEKRKGEVFNAAVVMPDQKDEIGLMNVRTQINDTLAVADANNAALGIESHLEKMWQEVSRFTDTNEIVRLNLQQIQVMFQEQFDKYYQRKAQHDIMLKEVLDKGEDYVNDYVEMQQAFKNEQAEDLKMIMLLSQRVEGMAKEYRQCALQKKWVVHIALVIQFKLAVESAIHRNVSDPNVLSAISDDIRRAAIELFRAMPEENV